MKKIFAILTMTLAVAALSSCIRKASSVFGDEKGSMNLVTKTCNVGEFDKIIAAGGAIHVYYTRSDTTSVKVEVPERFQKRLKLENNNGTLTIRFEGSPSGARRYVPLSGGGGKDGQYLNVYASSKMLRRVSLSGAGDIECKQPLHTDNLTVSIAGAGAINLADVTARHIEATVAGAGAITLLARKADLVLNIAGASSLDGTLKDCGNVSSTVSGAGKITLKGNAKHADNFASGASDVDISDLIVEDRK